MHKKKLGVDFDDVLMDFHTALAGFHNAQHGTAYQRENIFSFNLHEVWNVSIPEVSKRIFAFYESDEHTHAEPVGGASEALQRLSDTYALSIVTSKPEYMRERTLLWLEKHFPVAFDEIHFTNQYLGEGIRRTKKEICDELGLEVFIDDSLENVRDIAQHGRDTLLFDAPWNQGEVPDEVTRIHSWDEVARRLLGK